jgi:hypothetical protein
VLLSYPSHLDEVSELLIHFLPEILAALLFIEVIRGYRQRRHDVKQSFPASDINII